MILLIDNYDSFTFNIYDYICRTHQNVTIVKNDQVTIEQLKSLNIQKIVISPGPGNPDQAGISLSVVKTFCHDIPILGICLGHQIIAQHFGYTVTKAPQPMHGKIDTIYHDNQGVFRNLKNSLAVVRYHSLIVKEQSNGPLVISAKNKDGLIMALRHQHLPIESVQFHPEAIKTESGLQIITNFVNQ